MSNESNSALRRSEFDVGRSTLGVRRSHLFSVRNHPHLASPMGKWERDQTTTLQEHPMPSSPLTVGTKAPTFNTPSSTGKPVSLSDYAGKQAVVLYFYPKADTPGCTKEACGFRDALADYDS